MMIIYAACPLLREFVHFGNFNEKNYKKILQNGIDLCIILVAEVKQIICSESFPRFA